MEFTAYLIVSLVIIFHKKKEKSTSQALSQLIPDLSGKTEPIDLMINAQCRALVQENRQMLRPFIETINFLGCNGLPLHGHQDDFKFHSDMENYYFGQVGLFVNTLHFCEMSGDKVLENHLKSCPKMSSIFLKILKMTSLFVVEM